MDTLSNRLTLPPPPHPLFSTQRFFKVPKAYKLNHHQHSNFVLLGGEMCCDSKVSLSQEYNMVNLASKV